MISHSQEVIKAIDFITYSCSGVACIMAYVNHYSTIFAILIAFCSLVVSWVYKHLAYRNETKKLKAMFGEEK